MHSLSDDPSFGQDDTWDDLILPRLDLPEHDPPDLGTFLTAALDNVRTEVLGDLDGFAYSLVTKLGRLSVEWTEPLLVEPSRHKFLDSTILDSPWFRTGADLALAEVAVDRALSGFERIRELRPVASPWPLGERAVRYLREVSQLFLLGFDGPCIAFSGAALEQLLKQALVGKGYLTEADLRSRKLSGGELLDMARARGILTSSDSHASRIMHERDRAMHRHLWDPRIIRSMAAVAIVDLTAVLTELAGTAPEQGRE